MKEHKCEICGRLSKNKIAYYGSVLCNKHYKQIKKYGKPLDNNPRTPRDKNEIHICGDTAIIDIYNSKQIKTAEALIDVEDVSKVRYHKWRLNGSGYVINTPRNKPTNFLHRVILDTTEIVDHINHNPLDNRKCNLRIVTKSQNGMNHNSKGVTLTPKGAHYAYIKKDQKMFNLGVYYERNEAFYC